MVRSLKLRENGLFFIPKTLFIFSQKKHEIATHTFFHYYCLEKAQTQAEFAADLQAAIALCAASQHKY